MLRVANGWVGGVALGFITVSLGRSVTELRSCVKAEVDVLGSPSVINLRFLWT